MGGDDLPRGFESLPLRHFPPHNLARTASKALHNSPVYSTRRAGDCGRLEKENGRRSDDETSGQGGAEAGALGALGRPRGGPRRHDGDPLRSPEGAGSGKRAGVDFLCPFGGVETLYSLLTGDGFIRHTAASSVILLVGMLVMAVVYRRSFCGSCARWARCRDSSAPPAAGSSRRRLTVPRAVDRVARYLKYAVLVFFAVWTWQAAELVLRPYDPWVAWAHLTSADLLATSASASPCSSSRSPARWCTSASSASTSAPPAPCSGSCRGSAS